MMFAAYIAICLAGTPIQDCNQKSALVWTKAPGTHRLARCQFIGMAFVAEAGLTQPGDVVKVYCRSGNVG